MTNTNYLAEVEEAIGKWWCNLQFERKCSSTHTVKKIINNSPPEVQVHVKVLISKEIEQLLEKCLNSNDLKTLQFACNAINGCFDNFVHAVEAVNLLFSEIVRFIDLGLTECQNKLNLRSNQKNAVLELMHSLSRILILVLKLRRIHNFGKVLNTKVDCDSLQNYRCLLIPLTHKIGQFLMMEDILIDTKNNLSMAGILIREILLQDKDKLIQFHKDFIKSIPVLLLDGECKVNILKFLTCSAIINTWPVDVIGWESIYVYLKFFICLCEKYSSETPIVLNTSRTLLLLIKHEAFKEFINIVDSEKKGHIIGMLLSCIFMLLEHPVACVRHSAKDFLQLLATHPSLHSIMIDSVFKLPTDKRSYFISIGSLANEIGSDVLIKNNPELPVQMIQALSDPTIVSHVSLALEFVILNDSLSERNFPEWCETYVVPLLISLQTVLPIVGADIEKLLEKAFKKHPNSVAYVINKWSNPTSGEELRYVITALKISQKQGVKLKNNSGEENINNEETELISDRLLEHCLHQRDDDIRISAFSLLVEAHKTTKPYSERDFKLILYFLKYNLNNQQPATRQKIYGLIRKMLVRFSESKATFLKVSKNQNEEEKSKNCAMYDQFMDSLVDFCFSNIFKGCNFNRLNTVLNILLLSFENVKGMTFSVDNTDFYWIKFLIALDSSYEENKDLAATLIKNLDLNVAAANKPERGKFFYNAAFNMCTLMEPPLVLTGAYFLQALNNLPSSREVLSTYFTNAEGLNDVHYLCIQVLMEKLEEHIQLAKLDLMTAAVDGPMYGALFAIRLIFKNLDFSSVDGQPMEKSALEKWGEVINELVEKCFEMTRLVGCVVNSSSPEGHLPMDFQTDLENRLSSDFQGMCKIQQSSEELTCYKIENAVKSICTTYFKKCSKLIESDCESSDSLRTLNALLRENELLTRKVQAMEHSNEANKLLEELADALDKLKKLSEKFSKNFSEGDKVREWQPTAQVLLLCAWRSIKEASLFLGDLFTKLPMERAIELGLLTKETIIRIGEELKVLLCEIKHRGAFEQSYIGFTHLVDSLWKCSDKNLNALPRQWLEDIIQQLESPLSDQKVKLCSTRRSAGLPFLVQAIICSEVSSLKSTTPSSLHTTMKALLNIIENGVSDNPEAKIHALNILRALFKHAQLGEHVASYVSKALMVAIRGSRAATWSERNSSSLLFSSLVIRIFGVSRSREEISKKNRMTSRTFFQRYSDLYDFLLSEMELVHSEENSVDGIYPKPSLYLVLLILGRLYPPPTEDPGNIDLSEFLPYIDMSRRNPTMKIRELGARALVPLISLDRLKDELGVRFSVLSSEGSIRENERHGILLQIKELLSQSQDSVEKLSKETTATSWVKSTEWMMNQKPNKTKQICLVTLTTLVKVFHILHKHFPSARETIALIMRSAPIGTLYTVSTDQVETPYLGLNLFLENFYFLQVDVLAREWLTSGNSRRKEELFQLLTFLLKSGVAEMQSVPLRILNHVLKESAVDGDDDDDDFAGIGVPLSNLFLLETEENVKSLEKELLERSEILSYLTENLENVRPLVIRRIWLSVWSALFMKNVVYISRSGLHPRGPCRKVDFADSLITSKDKSLSTAALICSGVYYMEEDFARHKSDETKSLERCLSEFSCSDADVKERLAVAKIMNQCFRNFPGWRMASDLIMLKIWMIPLKLLVDEDAGVRMASEELVWKIQEYVIANVPREKLLLQMKTLDWPHLPLVSLKAQECLLDCYINILGEINLQYLIVLMLSIALSNFFETMKEAKSTKRDSKEQFGVFEKGNPNPFCEDLALSNLMCQKLTELGRVTDLDAIMSSPLDKTLIEFLEEITGEEFRGENAIENLHQLVKCVVFLTTVAEMFDEGLEEFEICRVQGRNLIEALGLKEKL